jgi:predicted ester cyclase
MRSAVAESKEVFRRFYEAMNAKDAPRAAAMRAPNGVHHGRKIVRESLLKLFKGAHRVHDQTTIHQMVADGDWVACRLTASGRHRAQPPIQLDGGTFSRTPPTGSPFTAQHIHLFRIVDGQISEHWANRDDLAAARQIGLELSPAKSPPMV